MVSRRFRALAAAAACAALPLAAAQEVPSGESPAAPKSADAGGVGQVGPAWTYDPSVEKPAGKKDMGSWAKTVYTSEQQARLGVDQNGAKVRELAAPNITDLMAATPRPRCAAEGKAWRDGNITSPNGGYLVDADACQLSCIALPFCKVFTYFADSKACWLQDKTAEVTEYDSPTAINGPKSCDEEEIVKGMKLSFDGVDLDKDGVLGKAEALVVARNLLKGELHTEPSEARIEEVAKEMDISTGADGVITLDDYETFMWRRLGKQRKASADHIASVEVAKASKPECADVGLAWNDPLVKSPNGGFLPSAIDCQRSCILMEQCSRFTYYANTKACWLQSAKSTLFPATAAISGPKSCSEGQASAVHAAADREFVGGSGPLVRVPEFALNVTALVESVAKPSCAIIGNAYHDSDLSYPNGAYLADAAQCQMSCQVSPSCKVFTYYADRKACWLHSDADKESKYPAAISGPKDCPGVIKANMTALLHSVAKPSCAMLGQAYHDLKTNIPTGGYLADATHCQALCKTRQDCVVFTYYADSKACWLQSGYFTQFGSEPAISGPKDCDADSIVAVSQSLAAATQAKPAILPLVNVTDLMRGIAKPLCARKGTAYHDHLGNGHPSRLAVDANECQLACSEDLNCKQFSFYADTRACWLQGDHRTHEFEYPTAISGPRSCSVNLPEVSPASRSVDLGVTPGAVVEKPAAAPTMSPSDLVDLVAKTEKPPCSSAGKAYHDPSVTYPNGAYVAHATDCQTSCRIHLSCKVFTFYADTKACWLQGENATEFASDAAISGPKACAAPLAASVSKALPAINMTAVAKPSCASVGKAYHDPSVTYPNGAYLAEAIHCQMSCEAHLGCHVFTYFADSKACWLQGENATETEFPSAISGPKSCSDSLGAAPAKVPTLPPPDYTVLMAATSKPACAAEGKAYRDPNVTSPNGAYPADADACQLSCMASPFCKVFTYFADSKACWLQAENSEVVEYDSPAAINGPKACNEKQLEKNMEFSFAQADLDKNGVFSKAEAASAAKQVLKVELHAEPTQAQIEDLVSKFDSSTGADGEITLDDFKTYMWRRVGEQRKAELGRVFDVSASAIIKPNCSTVGLAFHDPLVKTPNGAFVATAGECQAACARSQKCGHFTYYANTNACWLLSAESSVFPATAAISGPKTCGETVAAPTQPPVDVPWVMANTNRPICSHMGKAYHYATLTYPNGLYVHNAMSCQRSCAALFSCKVFTYYVNTKACWLQGGNITEFASEAAISGPKSCEVAEKSLSVAVPTPAPINLTSLMASAPKPLCSSGGKAYDDPAVTYPNGAYLANARNCQTSCRSHSKCKVFTFYVNSGACWLLGENATEFSSEAAISGPKACADVNAPTSWKGVNLDKLELPDGYTKLADGSVKFPDGIVMMPDLKVNLPNGVVRMPNADGQIELTDGSLLLPDFSLKLPDGSIKLPDGTVEPPVLTLPKPKALPAVAAPTTPPVDVSWLMANTNRPVCSHTGKAYHDPTVTSVNGAFLPNARACQRSCAGLRWCKVFTYYVNSKACWLQTENATEFASEAAISGPQACESEASAPSMDLGAAAPITVPTVAPLVREFKLNVTALLESVAKPPCAHLGKAYHDPSVTYPNGAYLAEATHCQMSCQANPSCQFFTYYADSKACWLQGGNATEIEFPAAISGPKSCSKSTEPALGLGAAVAIVPTLPPPNFTALQAATSRPRCAAEGTAYRDPNVTAPNGAYLTDADACQLACMASPFCEVFTYFVDSQACWLQQKNLEVAEYASPAAISGPKSCDEQQLSKGIQMSFDETGAKNGILTKDEARLAAKSLLTGELHAEPTQAQIEAVVAEMDLSTGGDGVITSDDYETYMWRRIGKERQVSMARLSALELAKAIRPNCSDVGLAYHDPLVTSPNGGYPASSLDCQNLCMLSKDCGRFTFYANSHACWLQSAKSSVFPSTAAISGPKTCSEQDIADVKSQISNSPFQPIMRVPEFALNRSALMASVAKPSCAKMGKGYNDPSVTYPNGAYLADATHCQMSCRINPSCRVFTYYADSKACWLQGENTTAIESEFAISGPQSCEEPDAANLTDVVLRKFVLSDADDQPVHTSPAGGIFTSAGSLLWLSFVGMIVFGAYAGWRGRQEYRFQKVCEAISLDEETGSLDSNALLAEQRIIQRAPLDEAATRLQL